MDVLLVNPALRFEQLVAQHQRELWRYVRFLGAAAAEADDVVQEAFLEVWRRPFVEYNDRATAAYLRRVARSQFLMRLRRRGREPALADLEQAEAEWSAARELDGGGDARLDALRACLETLKEQARRAFDLLYAERRDREQVAATLGLEAEGLKTLIRRGKLKLRGCVDRRLRREEHEP